MRKENESRIRRCKDKFLILIKLQITYLYIYNISISECTCIIPNAVVTFNTSSIKKKRF